MMHPCRRCTCNGCVETVAIVVITSESLLHKLMSCKLCCLLDFKHDSSVMFLAVAGAFIARQAVAHGTAVAVAQLMMAVSQCC